MYRTSQAVATALLVLLPGVCAAQSVNMGSTFHALEARATRVTTTFPDAVIDVRRGEGQQVEAVLRTRGGAVRGRLHVAPGTRRVTWHGARADAAGRRVRPARPGDGRPRLGSVPVVCAARRRGQLPPSGSSGRGRRRGGVGWPRASKSTRDGARHVRRTARGTRGACGDRVRRPGGARGTRQARPAEDARPAGRLLEVHGHDRRCADRDTAGVRALVRHGPGAHVEDRGRKSGRDPARAAARRMDVHAHDGLGQRAGLSVRHAGDPDARARGAHWQASSEASSSVRPRPPRWRRSRGPWRRCRPRRWPCRAPSPAPCSPTCRP